MCTRSVWTPNDPCYSPRRALGTSRTLAQCSIERYAASGSTATLACRPTRLSTSDPTETAELEQFAVAGALPVSGRPAHPYISSIGPFSYGV